MPVQQTLQSEQFAADAACILGGVRLGPQRRHLLSPNELGLVSGHGVLDTESTIDQLHRGVMRDAKLESAKNIMIKSSLGGPSVVYNSIHAQIV